MHLHNSGRLLGLDEETDRRLPCLRSLAPNQRGQIWRLAKMYCFISKEIIFDKIYGNERGASVICAGRVSHDYIYLVCTQYDFKHFELFAV